MGKPLFKSLCTKGHILRYTASSWTNGSLCARYSENWIRSCGSRLSQVCDHRRYLSYFFSFTRRGSPLSCLVLTLS